MILRLRKFFNPAIKWVDITGFSVFVAPYSLYKHGSDLGQIACTSFFEKLPFQNFGLKSSIYFMDLRKINFEHVNKMNISRVRLGADNDISVC